MYKKDFFLKLFIVSLIILAPIVVAIFYTKKHTVIENKKELIIDSKLFLHKWNLLYVGYTGCSTICTPRLEELTTLQRVLKDKGREVGFYFLDLRTLEDDVSRDFLKAFRGDFHLISLEQTKKNQLLQDLGFYYSKSLYDSNEYEHTSYLYLVKNDGNKIELVATIMQYPFANDPTIEFLEQRIKNDTQK